MISSWETLVRESERKSMDDQCLDLIPDIFLLISFLEFINISFEEKGNTFQ
jgi:hypothetical protein